MTLDESFVAFVQSLFPSISPYIEAETKHNLEQFYKNGKTFECYNPSVLDGICQGDIIENVSLIRVGEDGEITQAVRTVIVLSNSCDIENDDYIVVAPFFSFTEVNFNKSRIEEMKLNKFYGKLYFPDVSEEPMFADFSFAQSLPKRYFQESLKNNTMKILHSLNLVGYYLFLCKLTIHFMRPENADLQNERKRIDYSL